MSVPSQPSGPQNRRACHAASTPRPAAADAGPPIIPEPELEDYPNPPQQDEATGASGDASPPRPPRLGQPPRGQRLVRKADGPAPPLTGEQRLLLLDTWRRSGLPAGDFAAFVGGL